jgi:Zn-dependent peptidase ImmA (M78 family)/DNA-binding XRE family transcriptional regulator
MDFKEIFAYRLKTARKIAGLSMDELVNKLGKTVTKSAIGKYESGKMLPGSRHLSDIAKALNVNIDFFFRRIDYKLSEIEFRKKSSLQKKIQKKIEGEALDYAERYLELENILNKKIIFKNPISDIEIKSHEDIEIVATDLRKKWNLGKGPILNLLSLLEEKGFIIYVSDESDNFDGMSARLDGIPFIFINKKKDNLRKRFTALHEVAHLILKFPISNSNNQNEKICHEFAGTFLIPPDILKNELGIKRSRLLLKELINIKETYGISVQALVSLANKLDIISDKYYEQICIYFRKNHLQKEEGLGDYKGIENTTRFENMIYYAVSEQIISLSKGASLSGKSLAEFREEIKKYEYNSK